MPSPVGTIRGLEERLRRRMELLHSGRLMRQLRPPSGVDLCSNDYLGLAAHPVIKERMAEAVLREGVGSTGSRLLRGERESFSRLERRFADFKGAEGSLYFSSGYLANLAVMTTFCEAGDVIFSDERNHASLIDGMRLSRAKRVVFPHNDPAALARLLESEPSEGEKFVVAESLFSMDGDEAPLQKYAALCREYGATLIVDEAHAVGIYGDRGSGLIEELGVGGDVFVSVNTAGKALGVSGAFVAGSCMAIEYLIQRARPFVFSTAPPPAVASAIDAALEIVRNEPDRRERVLARAGYVRARLGFAGVAAGGRSQIVPVIVGENHRTLAVAQELQSLGFDVRAIRPPTVPEGTARLRISVNEGISEAVLDQFTDALATALQRQLP
jgi:8-amino-7-oxononanoate synthase